MRAIKKFDVLSYLFSCCFNKLLTKARWDWKALLSLTVPGFSSPSLQRNEWGRSLKQQVKLHSHLKRGGGGHEWMFLLHGSANFQSTLDSPESPARHGSFTIAMDLSISTNIIRFLLTIVPHNLSFLSCGFMHLDNIMCEGLLKDNSFLWLHHNFVTIIIDFPCTIFWTDYCYHRQ